MNNDEIIDKVKSFSHTEFNKKEFLNQTHIDNCVKKGLDLFGRKGEDLYKEENLSFLPEIVKNNIEIYDKFIAK